jgi:hypothetical protein
LCMSEFDDRERAFDLKFERDEEMQFRIMARRNRLLGEWAAGQMGLSEVETEAYAKDVVPGTKAGRGPAADYRADQPLEGGHSCRWQLMKLRH